MANNRQQLSVEATAYLINHVVLPPKLPQADDYDVTNERQLIETTIQAVGDLKAVVNDDQVGAILSAIATIKNLLRSRGHHGDIAEAKLQALLAELVNGTADGSILLEVKAQNAGILASRGEHHVTFEFFELSASNQAVISTEGRLVRTFPDGASKISTRRMGENGLQTTLSYTIAKMSTQAAPGFQPQVRKKGKNHDEIRDTTNPGMVTDYLMNVITALGETTEVDRITKHTRDEVFWKSCKKPWRRSPLWLLLRVFLQLFFTRNGEAMKSPDTLYKAFQVMLLSRLLSSAKRHWAVFGSDVLYTISAKLLRKLRKLESSEQADCLQPGWADQILAGIQNAHLIINERWQAVVNDASLDINTAILENIQPGRNVDMFLPDLDGFLSEVASRKQAVRSSIFKPTAMYPDFPGNELPAVDNISGEYKLFWLAALEKWVEKHLLSWTRSHGHDSGSCRKLRDLIESYHRIASDAYGGIPMNTSVMYLTILELWIACDKSACSIHPLLFDYDPEIDLAELQCLCLPLRSQMVRVHEVERYIQARKGNACNNNPSVYRDFGHLGSFPVRFHDQSPELQRLMSLIEQEATKKRQQKIKELAKLKEDYMNLMFRYDNSECETQTVTYYNGYIEDAHKYNCSRCAFKSQADALNIQIYEWPLSSERSIAKATVFELRTPEAFSEWRDASIHVITNVLGSHYTEAEKPENSYTLDRHPDLSHMLPSHYPRRRIMPLSSVKPHTATHRNNRGAIPNLEDNDVCLENALAYHYYDKSRSVWTSNLCLTEKIPQDCMYQLPHRSKALQRFLYKPPSAPDGVACNEVMASLSDCPAHFSIDEYKAFGVLALGRNIVYSNILAQLAIPTLDFAKSETQCLVMQAIHQVGPSTSCIARASHNILREEAFCEAMIDQLEIALQRVAENWESWRALATFVQLSRRILSLTLSAAIQQRCLAYLDETRHVCMKWIGRLKQGAASSTDDERRTDLHSSATEIALLGTSTFDVEEEFVDQVLQYPFAISSLVQCSVVVQEHLDLIRSEHDGLLRCMLQTWKSLMYRMFSKLCEKILSDNEGLNEAVLANWAAFQPGSDACWSLLDRPHEHWLHVTSGALPVHFNLLTAELLVNGLPLDRLPSEFMKHPIYTPLFQRSALEVVPTDEPGMSFSAKSIYHDYKLHFGMMGQDMLVVAVRNHLRFDLIPSRVFENQMPDAFVTQFIHWYDHDRDQVIFRPRQDPWSTESTALWHLRREGASWRLARGTTLLVNMSSDSARTLSGLFSQLEEKMHIHIIYDMVSQNTEIELPRLQLGFYFVKGEPAVHSRQYRGFILDCNQRIGSLCGLESKLVLRKGDTANNRIVLIPEGSFDYGRASSRHHVSVTINKGTIIQVHAYPLDNILGRIQDSGDLQSKLLLCYLHALTSNCLPDPLTGFPGTESALSILNSAAVRSFGFLAAENVTLLTQIAKLSPGRKYYPQNLMVMQQVTWDNKISPLSQHSDFHTSVQTIFNHARKMKLFFSDKNCTEPEHLTGVDPHLQQRDIIRSSTFRVLGSGAERFTATKDKIYEARGGPRASERGQRAFVAATMILREETALNTSIADLKGALMQAHFDHVTVKGTNRLVGPSILRFDSKWLGNLSELLRELWCSLDQALTESSGTYNKFSIMAWLSTMAYAKSADMNVVQALAAFYRSSSRARAEIPFALSFELAEGSTCKLAEIRAIALRAARDFNSCPESRLPKESYETYKQYKSRVQRLFESKRNGAIERFSSNLQNQWPCESPNRPTSADIDTYLKTSTAMMNVTKKFKTWHDNKCFMEYLQRVSTMISFQQVIRVSTPCSAIKPSLGRLDLSKGVRYVNMKCVFDAVPPTIPEAPSEPNAVHHNSLGKRKTSTLEQSQPSGNSFATERLERLCHKLEECAESKHEKSYVENLRKSCASLQVQDGGIEMRSSSVNTNNLRAHLNKSAEYFKSLNSAMAQVVRKEGTKTDQIGFCVQQSPRVSPTFWLSYLHRDRFHSLSDPWKKLIIEYGLAITRLHRAHRLFALSNTPVDLAEELLHVGHSNWSPWEFPETLLLEAESGIMVREVQEVIAQQMRNPPGDKNTVCQLNMGEGKSSTIVPILATALADKKTLVRVMVARPQSQQMFQMLVSKLGGLLNQPIYHMPFSRSIQLSVADAQFIRETYEECMKNRGIMLVQPEHVLSFKLMGVECLLTKRHDVARSLLDTQQFFDNVSRDIVDESDENFSVKFELVYTMGSQRAIDFAPERWSMVQEILSIIPRYAAQVAKTLPHSIEIQESGNGRFPRLRLLRDDAADQLLELLATHIVEYGLSGLPIRNQSPETQVAVLRYITQTDLTAEDIKAVEGHIFWTDTTKSPLLLVRGLIAGGVLRFSLMSKRWRVNFGPDPSRRPSTKLAVPYRSKDCPSPRSEFSHPDVVILFTLLSYYYGGLNDEELFDAFIHLRRSDQAEIQYNEWVVAAPNLPEVFKQLSGVNIKDRILCIQQIFPFLRYSKAVVDYYLSHFVFPKEMKEFPHKISTSGWDIGAIKTHPTTGFSGTNDTLHLLPLAVNHLDLQSQSHTNALVLAYLLQDESSVEILSPHGSGTLADHLLNVVTRMSPEVRVILDVGALVLEMNNLQVAERWLAMSKNSHTQAIVFFHNEELSVLDCKGRLESFQISPFAKQLDVCLVYLDEAHTRGTDLKLPRNYRAAVTLGASLTKDRLVQACMRMRKLGKGQSVVFMVPPEISTKIYERTGKSPDASIEVTDVLCWSIRETWLDLSRSMPLWAVQGHRFETHKHLLHGAKTTKEQAKSFLEDEAQSLEVRYRPRAREDSVRFNGWDMSNKNIAQIHLRCREFEAMGFGSSSLQEEQERELAPEIEEERQIQRPARMAAEKNQTHPDLRRLVRTGEIPKNSEAFKPAFQALHSASAAVLFDLTQFPSDLLVTSDFMRTVKTPAGSSIESFVSDSYQRPVQWVLSVPQRFQWDIKNFVILSPHEANELLTSIRDSDSATVTLHLFSARSNASYASLDRLELYNVGRSFSPNSVSQSLTMQLNLFSGSLYLRSFAEYTALCDHLGLLQTKAKDGQVILADGFITPPVGIWGLKMSPVPFLRALLMKIRKEGEGVEKTHLGKILGGLRLEEGDFGAD